MEKLICKPVTKECEFCRSREGEKRPVGNYMVKLRPVTVHGEQKHACQSCAHKHWSVLSARRKNHEEAQVHFHSRLQQMKNFAAMILHLGILLAFFSRALMAQLALSGGAPF